MKSRILACFPYKHIKDKYVVVVVQEPFCPIK